MASTFTAIPLEGINFKERYVPSLERPAAFALGTPTIGNQNDTWVYVQANVPAGIGLVTVPNTTNPLAADFFRITVAGAGTWRTDTAFLTGETGWVRLEANPLD